MLLLRTLVVVLMVKASISNHKVVGYCKNHKNMGKFNIGDKVKIKYFYNKSKIGIIGVVNDILFGNHYRIDNSNNYIQEECLEYCK